MAKSLGVYFFILYISTYFIGSAILMATWNYTIPKIAKSCDNTYNPDTKFSPIDYPTALVFMILLNVIFGSINCCLI